MSEIDNKMNSAISHYEKELNSLRTSRANPSMLDNILVDAYGSKTPVNQLGNISIQDASTITIQKLSEERRKEIIKIASEFAENSKVTIRNIRRDFIEIEKNQKKNSNLSEDELKRKINEIQKITDSNIEKIDKILEAKKNDIMKV